MSSEGETTKGALDTFERELRRAASLLGEGRFEQAYTWASEALALRPAHLVAQNLLGLILYQQHRFAPALTIFETLVRKNPDVITLRMNAGLAALHGGELERAVEHLRRAVDLDPGHHRAFTALALAHLRRGEIHLGRAALLEANQEALAAGLSDPLRADAVKQLEADLCTQAEELPPSVDVAPCEGFAEVGALAPLDGWRKADLTASPSTAQPSTAEQPSDKPSPEPEPEPEPEPGPEPEAEAEKAAAPPEPLAASQPEPEPEPQVDTAPQLVTRTPSVELQAEPEPEHELVAPAEPEGSESHGPGPAPAAPASVERKRLQERLAALGWPAQLHAADAAIRQGALIVRLEATNRGVLLRPDRVLIERGDLEHRPASRRRKGAESGPFVVDGCQMQLVRGEGLLVLRGPSSSHLELLHLDQEALFVRESALIAASAELSWENGRVPGTSDDNLRLVHAHGNGFLAVVSWDRPFAVRVDEEHTVRIRSAHLLGWSGPVVPELLPEEGMVGFSGSGVLLLQLAELTARPVSGRTEP